MALGDANELQNELKQLNLVQSESELASKDNSGQSCLSSCDEVLFVEPFYGGSHKQLIDTLRNHLPKSTLVTTSAKKWPWRARCGALVLSRLIPKISNEKILFCSSVLSLAELLGLRHDLQPLKKVVYFHENQLVYPVQAIKERDVQYGYNQITTCLAADVVVFNSHFNKNSFLDNIHKIINLLPDFRPKKIREDIEAKCQVIYFPVECPKYDLSKLDVLHIIWPHRWEFDKDPETFFEILKELKNDGVKFKVSILGEKFQEVPEVFNKAFEDLLPHIMHFGFASKEVYYNVLAQGHVVISTAKHEFFGVAMLEATCCSCLPLVPNRLVYPEIYPEECRYNSKNDLFKKLKMYSRNLERCIEDGKNILSKMDVSKYSVENLLPQYAEVFHI